MFELWEKYGDQLDHQSTGSSGNSVFFGTEAGYKPESVWSEGVPGTDDEEKPLTVAERSLLQKVLHRGLVENKYDIEIERRNPKSPLYSVKSFEALNLKPELLKVGSSIGPNSVSVFVHQLKVGPFLKPKVHKFM